MIKRIIAVFFLMPICVFAQNILAFTDEQHPINDPNKVASICTIINADLLINQVNIEIQNSKISSQEQVGKKFGNEFHKISDSYKCLNKANELSVDKLPTIVINGHLIVGLTDVPTVISRYGDSDD